MYSLKNVKSFDTDDGYAFSATIYKGKEKIATVENSGRGGCNFYHFVTMQASLDFKEFVQTTEHKDDFEADDSYVEELFIEWEKEKTYKRWCKKAIVFRLKTDEGEGFRTISPKNKAAWSDTLKMMYIAKIKAEHGDNIEEILNERYV